MRMIEVLVTVILLGILAISLSVMQIVLQDFSDTNICADAGGVVFTGTGNATNATPLTNPLITDSYSGCCSTVNNTYQQGVDNGGYCLTWLTSNYALNSTVQGQISQDNISGWQSTIGTVVAVAFILTLLIGSLLGAVMRGRGKSEAI